MTKSVTQLVRRENQGVVGEGSRGDTRECDMCQYTTSCCIAYHIDLTLLMYSRYMWIATFLRYVTWKWTIITLLRYWKEILLISFASYVEYLNRCNINLSMVYTCSVMFDINTYADNVIAMKKRLVRARVAGWTCCMLMHTCSEMSAICVERSVRQGLTFLETCVRLFCFFWSFILLDRYCILIMVQKGTTSNVYSYLHYLGLYT